MCPSGSVTCELHQSCGNTKLHSSASVRHRSRLWALFSPCIIPAPDPVPARLCCCLAMPLVQLLLYICLQILQPSHTCCCLPQVISCALRTNDCCIVCATASETRRSTAAHTGKPNKVFARNPTGELLVKCVGGVWDGECECECECVGRFQADNAKACKE